MLTQISVRPFVDTLGPDLEINVFAIRKKDVTEIPLSASQEKALRGIGQFYATLPPQTKRLEIELGEKLLSVELMEDNPRVVEVPFPVERVPAAPPISPWELIELTEAIAKSLPDGYLSLQYGLDEDESNIDVEYEEEGLWR